MIPCSSKSKILQLLLTLEAMFISNQRLQNIAQRTQESTEFRETPSVAEPMILYLEHMSKETIDVAKSHTSWMLFKDNSQF